VTYINGVNLLPGTGEFTLDTIAHTGQRVTQAVAQPTNFYASGTTPLTYSGESTDFPRAIDDLQASFPGCTTVAIVVSWFFDSTSAGACRVYPSTTYQNPTGSPAFVFWQWNGSSFAGTHWVVSSLNEYSAGVPPISTTNGEFTYGGTPSDQSVVRAIEDLKSRGLRVVFYPFLLGDVPGSFPWRGRITHSPDMTTAAEDAVADFLGTAAPGDFTRDAPNRTVSYSSPLDFTYRRMILHYANLCVIAGGVDLFIIGSELRGLESIRGAGWTKSGGGPPAAWDYPFIAGLSDLADDVRGVFDGAGLTKDLVDRHNLISYAADWSSWMGYQHPGEDGQWPHLDALWAHSNIDVVAFDNYLPLSDWTAGTGGLDVVNWSAPKFAGTWPPDETQMHGLGLTGTPVFPSKAYFKANIEGGEKFNWFYAGADENLGRGFDPLGSGAQVSRPQGARRAQVRSRFFADQELLANKQIRWWWSNTHRAIYDTGAGFVPQGSATAWVAQAKPVVFTEYGYPSCDRGTNQPNLFFDPRSSESGTPFWSVWDPVFGGGYAPRRDRELAPLALQAMHEYWFADGNNEVSGAGVPMIEQKFCSVWTWDARPFPAFPKRSDVWGDAPNWDAGHWLEGKAPFFPAGGADPPPSPGTWPAFPVLAGQGWSVTYAPRHVVMREEKTSGRETRAALTSAPLLEIELVFNVLRMESPAEFETLVGFYADRQAAAAPFTFPVPTALGFGASIVARFAEDRLDLEEFASRLWRGESVRILQVRGE
jgi:hypothetical protein